MKLQSNVYMDRDKHRWIFIDRATKENEGNYYCYGKNSKSGKHFLSSADVILGGSKFSLISCSFVIIVYYHNFFSLLMKLL